MGCISNTKTTLLGFSYSHTKCANQASERKFSDFLGVRTRGNHSFLTIFAWRLLMSEKPYVPCGSPFPHPLRRYWQQHRVISW